MVMTDAPREKEVIKEVDIIEEVAPVAAKPSPPPPLPEGRKEAAAPPLRQGALTGIHSLNGNDIEEDPTAPAATIAASAPPPSQSVHVSSSSTVKPLIERFSQSIGYFLLRGEKYILGLISGLY